MVRLVREVQLDGPDAPGAVAASKLVEDLTVAGELVQVEASTLDPQRQALHELLPACGEVFPVGLLVHLRYEQGFVALLLHVGVRLEVLLVPTAGCEYVRLAVCQAAVNLGLLILEEVVVQFFPLLPPGAQPVDPGPEGIVLSLGRSAVEHERELVAPEIHELAALPPLQALYMFAPERLVPLPVSHSFEVKRREFLQLLKQEEFVGVFLHLLVVTLDGLLRLRLLPEPGHQVPAPRRGLAPSRGDEEHDLPTERLPILGLSEVLGGQHQGL